MGLFDSSLSSITQGAVGAAGAGLGFDPTNARLAVAGLIPGGSIGLKIGGAKVNLNLGGGAPDWRLRVSLADSANYFYHAQSPTDRGIMSPLFGSQTQNGVIFPYTPQVQVTHTASYSQQKFTHSNYPGYYYENSEVAAITINGDFTVQNNIEGQYLLAAITFFRAATKMWFGQSKGNLGFPPPMVFLNGYGANYLPNVPCVITSFSHTMPSDCDYIEVPMVMPGSVGAGGVGGAIAQGVGGIMNGGNAGDAIGGALSGGLNSVLGSTMGPSGAGINGLIGSLSGGKFGAGAGGTQSTRLPTSSQLSVSLQPIYSRTAVSNFNLDDFAAGRMVGKGNKGGFI
jgi:hypothetical protein